ncbi:MAG: GntR family transcriptional regulator [Prevotella sp.]|nr:GntR family transcriptional regulator [Prevotella sp.]MCI6370389.1 GntR family transcriptional regulator [Prevotella sp.]MCI6403219.1 GntR family transcriptional regulator [Prevotella sp.]MCI6447485.1 GntR family transcriptional regulator [Prevotella sp.]MCI6509374.1 GntR family transcriptional regulator [Prevotella sp.]
MFTQDRPIYLQMADRMMDEILAGTYSDDMRIPSVREYGMLLQVNTNTAVKCYEQLSRDGIIYQRRGMGYYVTAGARDRIMAHRKEIFFNETIPQLKHDMELLGISIEELLSKGGFS